jgi:hypothetical protein
MAKSGRKSGDQILGVMPAKKAAQFLCDLANLRPPRPDMGPLLRIFSRYPDIFSGHPNDQDNLNLAEVLSKLLRRAWDAPDLRRREWFVHHVEAVYHKLYEWTELEKAVGDPAMVREILGDDYLRPGGTLFNLRMAEPPGEVSPIEAAMFYFKRNAGKTRHCPNSNCVAPYFFATKKGQKYCSSECALPARRESKLRWWHDNKGK